MLCHCKKVLLNGLYAWGSRFNGLLALTAVSCFAIDIAFFSEAKQYYATNHALLGSAVWYTLGGSAILLLGGWLFEIQSSQSNQLRASALSQGPLQRDLDHPQDLPNRDIESGIQFEEEQPHEDVEELPIALHNALNRSVRNEESDRVTSPFTTSNPYIDSTASPASGPRDKQPKHTLEGQAGGLEAPSLSSGGSQFEWALVGKTISAESLHKRASTVSGYAPMSYHTYNESESSPTSVQPSQISPSPIDEESPTLQPASVTVHTSRSSKHSVVDPYNRPASWLSRNYTKLKKPRPRKFQTISQCTLSDYLSQVLPAWLRIQRCLLYFTNFHPLRQPQSPAAGIHRPCPIIHIASSPSDGRWVHQPLIAVLAHLHLPSTTKQTRCRTYPLHG